MNKTHLLTGFGSEAKTLCPVDRLDGGSRHIGIVTSRFTKDVTCGNCRKREQFRDVQRWEWATGNTGEWA